MNVHRTSRVAVVDYGMGNLFSVRQACLSAGLDAELTSDPDEVRAADGVVVPGVGAFGSAMETLCARGLDRAIIDTASKGTLVMGICLGMQLLMEQSHEFGLHAGLGLIPGDVVQFPRTGPDGQHLKVPQVCWNQVWRPQGPAGAGLPPPDPWAASVLDGLADGEHLYFVHSYYVRPRSAEVVLAETEYGGVRFCSAVWTGNIIGCQFHPERSGSRGMLIYQNLAAAITKQRGEERNG